MERSWAPRHWPESHLTGVTLIAAAAMLAAPLWNVWAPAMPDYPAHLASFALIEQGTGNRFYHLRWDFVPNLASEVLVPILARLTGLVAAAKLFLTAAIFLWVLGPGAVHRALYGRTGIAPLFGSFFAYNGNFTWGFFNYYFSAGLSFAIFAAWIASEKHNGLARIAGFTLAVTLLYFCHVFAVASLLLMLVGFEMSQNFRLERSDPKALARRAVQIAILYGPAGLAFLFLRPHGQTDDAVIFNLADNMLGRFQSLVQHSFGDSAIVLPIALFAGLALALWLRKARIHPAMWGTLGLLLAGAIFAPESAFGGWGVHLRLPAVFGAMLFASAELPMKPATRTALVALVLVMIGWFALTMAQNWLVYDRQVREFQAALEEVPRGARMLTVLDGDAIGERPDEPYWHMAEFAVPERGVFTPLLFTTKGQHVVQLNPPFQKYAAASARQGSPPDVDELDFLARGQMVEDEGVQNDMPYLNHFQCHFGIAVVVHLDGKRTPVPAMLRLRHAGTFFSFYDIQPDGYCKR